MVEQEELKPAEPRECAVCERVCPVSVLADLEIAEVCEVCKPAVMQLVAVRRLGAGSGDDAIQRAAEVARQLDQVCAEAERHPPAARP